MTDNSCVCSFNFAWLIHSRLMLTPLNRTTTVRLMHKYEVMIDFLTMIVVPCTILHIYLHGYLQIETPPSGCLQPIPICHCQSWNLKGYTIITHGLLNLVQLLFKQPVLYDVIYCLEIFVKYKHIHLPKLSTVIKQKNKQN